MFFLDITNGNGIPFRVRYYPPGEFAADRNAAPNEGRVDFLDARREYDDRPIASYYDTSLLAHGEPLDWPLHTGMPDMTLDGPTINRVLAWLRTVSVHARTMPKRDVRIIPPTGDFVSGPSGLVVAYQLTEYDGAKGEGWAIIRRSAAPDEARAYSTHHVYTMNAGLTWFADNGNYLMSRADLDG